MERSVLVAAFAITAFACSKADPVELDRQDLKNAFALDAPLDRALKQAEDESTANHDDAAADILKRTAVPSANAAVDAVNAVHPRSDWGRIKKNSLVAIETERRDELSHYERSLRGTDLDDKLSAVQKQLDLEKRVMAFSAEIDAPP